MQSNSIENFKKQRATRYKKSTPTMPKKYAEELEEKDFSWLRLFYAVLSIVVILSTTALTTFLWLLMV